MKSVLRSCFLIIALAIGSCGTVYGQTAHRVAIRGTISGANASCEIILGSASVSSTFGGVFNGFASIHADKEYELAINATDMGANAVINLIPPDGYHFFINGTQTNRLVINSGSQQPTPVTQTYQVTLRARTGGLPGTATALDLSQDINWGVNLGRLYHGTSAGAIVIRQAALDSSTLNRAVLNYSGIDNQVAVLNDAYGNIRQIVAPEVFVDIIDLSPAGFCIGFYPLSAMGPIQSNGLRSIGNPAAKFISYEITEGSAGPGSIAVRQIAGTDSDVTDISRVGNKTITTLDNELVREERTEGLLDGDRTETVIVKNAANVIARKVVYRYHKFPWNGQPGTATSVDELIEATAYSDNTEASAHRVIYSYYTDASQEGSYTRIKSVVYPDGNWVKYEYYADLNRSGQVSRVYSPWLDTPGDPEQATESNCMMVEYDYSQDWYNLYRFLSSQITKVNGTIIGKSEYDHVHGIPMPNLLGLLATTTKGYASNNSSLTNVIKTYYASPDVMLGTAVAYDKLPYSMSSSNGSKISYVQQLGDYDVTAKTFAASANGSSIREIALSGLAAYIVNAVNFTSYTSDGVTSTIDDIYLVPNRSTRTITIRQNGRVLREEVAVFTGGTSFDSLAWTDFEYTDSGRLYKRISSNGTLYEANWVNEFKTSETTETGETYQYSPDAIGRISSVVKSGVPAFAAGNYAAQQNVITDFDYSAAGDLLKTSVSAGGITLTSESTYDWAGRMLTSNDDTGAQTSYAYNLSDRKTTVTKPSGGTDVSEYHRNGLAESETGSGRVSRYYYYSYGADGSLSANVLQGSTTSAATSTVKTDWLGRVVESKSPVPNATGQGIDHVLNAHTYNSLGQLTKVQVSGQKPVVSTYDAFGMLQTQGLDVDDNGLVANSKDRLTRFSNQYYKDSSNTWWLQSQRFGYPKDNQSTEVLLSDVRTRLSNFSAGYIAEVQSIDAFGNVSLQKSQVDRAQRLAYAITDLPGVQGDAETVTYNGRVVETISPLGESVLTSYDAIGRTSTVTHPRKGTKFTSYMTGRNLVKDVGYLNGPLLARYSYDTASRVIRTEDGLGNFTAQGFDGCSCGRVSRVWGSNTYPTAYEYDNMGRKRALITYRSGTNWDSETLPSANFDSAAIQDRTTFAYYGDTGFLSSRTDNKGKSTEYTYDAYGRLKVEKLARLQSGGTHVTRSLSYDAATGDLLATDYSDSTSDVSLTYNRLGQAATVTDATGTRGFTYDATTGLQLTIESLPAYFGSGRQLGYAYETSAEGAKGRLTTCNFGSAATPSLYQSQAYAYTANSQLNSITASPQNQSSRTFSYVYVAEQPSLVSSMSVALGTSLNQVNTREYDAQFDMVKIATTQLGSTVVSKHEYTFDALGHRLSAKQSGTAFADYGPNAGATFYLYNYNARGELTLATQYLGLTLTDTSKTLPGRSFEFGYDHIGNRTAANNTAVADLRADYVANDLNQIISKENHAVHFSGTAAPGTKVVANAAYASNTGYQGNFWSVEVSLDNVSTPAKLPVPLIAGKAGAGTGGLDALIRDERTIFLPPALETMSYDEDGNLLTDGRWSYSYDAKNQLIAMETRDTVRPILTSFPGGEQPRKLEFTYDFMGRRVGKKVYSYDTAGGTWALMSERRFVYHGWDLIAELDGSAAGEPVLRQFYWGLDIASSLGGTGGVGALLMIQDGNNSYFPAYDGNGNVTALTDQTGAIVASYEYSPFGELLRRQGSYADLNPFRFSTKWADDESGLVYYGLRYYSPANGRFVNVDPIREAGGINAYSFLSNNPINETDYLGLKLSEDDYDGTSQGYFGFSDSGSQYWGDEDTWGMSGREMLEYYFGPSDYNSDGGARGYSIGKGLAFGNTARTNIVSSYVDFGYSVFGSGGGESPDGALQLDKYVVTSVKFTHTILSSPAERTAVSAPSTREEMGRRVLCDQAWKDLNALKLKIAVTETNSQTLQGSLDKSEQEYNQYTFNYAMSVQINAASLLIGPLADRIPGRLDPFLGDSASFIGNSAINSYVGFNDNGSDSLSSGLTVAQQLQATAEFGSKFVGNVNSRTLGRAPRVSDGYKRGLISRLGPVLNFASFAYETPKAIVNGKGLSARVYFNRGALRGNDAKLDELNNAFHKKIQDIAFFCD